MKRKSTFLLLFLAVVVFATWQYRLLCILSLVLLNKEWIRSRPWMAQHKHSFKGLVASLLLAIFVAIPNYIQRGRTQLLYIDRNGHRTATPVPLYLINVLFPEEEVMNFCMKATALMPPAGSTGTSLLRDAQRDFWTGKALGFYTPYNLLSLQGTIPVRWLFHRLVIKCWARTTRELTSSNPVIIPHRNATLWSSSPTAIWGIGNSIKACLVDWKTVSL